MKSPSPHTPPSRSPRRLVSCIAAAAMIGFAATMASAAPSTTVVISQVYGGGGNSGAPYTNDFVELHNISNSTVSLAGWRIQYASATGSSWQGPNLSGSISPGAYYLIQLAGGANGVALPTPDLSATTPNLSGTAGKVALTNTTTALTGTNPSADAAVVDFVGFGTTANGFEGTGPTPAPSNTTSVTRKDFGSQDTDDNATDLTAGAPTPRNSSSPPYIPGGDNTPPVIVTYAPENGALDVPLTTTELVATFNEPVVKGTGSITLKLDADDSEAMTINVADTAVAVIAETVTITLPASLVGSTSYYVNIDAGAFKDLADNNFVGIADKVTWAFTTATPDLTPPAVVTLDPADDSSTALPTTNLVITYDEAILAGSGTVLIKKTSDASLVETITVPGAQVSVSGNSATINPAIVLDYTTGYYVEVSAGAFTDLSANDAPAISGATAWNFTTRDAPVLVISQYYEGVGSDRYIELKNLSGSPLPLDGYRVAAWNDTNVAGNQGWKTTGNSSDRISDLAGLTIPANGTLLITNINAAAPDYAVLNNDLIDNGGCTAINGNDSVVLYFSGVNPLAFTPDEVVDAISLTGNDGTDTSFYRLADGAGFDFSIGSSILDYSGVWGTKTLAEVASALPTDDWYLSASVPIGTLTLEILPSTVAESAGIAAASATVTRSGDTTESLFVIIESSNSVIADSEVFVEIPAGQSSADFFIDTIDNPWLDGDKVITFSVSADRHFPGSDTLTVQDNPEDLPFTVVINEVDSDNPGTDDREFIELYNNSSESVSLDGFVLVLYNGFSTGTGEASYLALDLSGQTIPGNGFFVAGNALVASASITFANNTLQNGQDAVALYFGAAASSFPNGTLASQAPGSLVDAVVYGTNDPDATVLLAALTPGKPQVDEGAFPASETVSIARVPDGGAAFASNLYVAQTPTPGATNVLPTFADWIAGFDVGLLTGFNDDFDNDGLANALENILGSDPSVSNQGLTAVSASAGSLVFRHTLAADADIAADLTFEYEWSVDLANWQASGASAGGTTVTFANPVVITPGVGGAPDLVEVAATVTGTPASKVFARLRVDQVVAP